MTINELVHILLEETEHDNRTPRVLQVMRENIDPEIGRMSEQELRDELSNAVFALYQMECVGYVFENNIEHYKEEASSSNEAVGFLQMELEIAPEKARKDSSMVANNARHASARKRHEKIKKIWANGNYSSRDICAEQEYSALGFGSFKAARNALKGTPDPNPWPAKGKAS